MTTAIPSGLGGTLGFAQETTYNTFVSPTDFIYFKKEAFEFKKTVVTSEAIMGGRTQLGSRRVVPAVAVDGSIELEVQERGMGLLFKNMLGSSVSSPTLLSGSAYQQVHALGNSISPMTFQVGRPDITGTLNSFSYTGCKCTDWTLGVAAGQIATLTLSLDGAGQSTSQTYAAPSYTNSGSPMHFAQGGLYLGGTTTTTSGTATRTGGTQLAGAGSTFAGAVKSINIKATNPMNTDRRTLGTTAKLNPLANAFVAITGDVEIEFSDLTTLYNVFAAAPETSTAIEFSLTGSLISGSNYATVDVLLPKVYLDTDQTMVEGPDILTQKVAFTALYDGTNTPVQITYTSADSSL